ncbi:uroporphyrinogen-III C-methyltransferase [Alkalilimnicola ehrlichii]|nr:uroporphyrinogen-III C-methyltransferase [Alkalilimnicola ehrlichii]
MRFEGERCLVIGSGQVALEELKRLTALGATVAWWPASADAEPELEESVEYLDGPLRHSWFAECRLAVVDARNQDINRQALGAAKACGVPAHCPDYPLESSLQLPVRQTRAGVDFALFGSDPAPLKRFLLAEVLRGVSSRWERIRDWCQHHDDLLHQHLDDAASRSRFWEQALAGPLGSAIAIGANRRAEELFEGELQALKDRAGQRATGEVYLIGAGPGDPDLLTLRALRLLQQADVVLYDRLVAPAIMELCSEHAERIYVGKRRAEHAVPQESLNAMLVSLAKKGKRVARLKGGDPFIFGRGGEEIETLMEEGVLFQVVPGITAASGCAAYAGIPLTHRDYAQSCTFVTGHRKHGRLDLDFARLVRPEQTVVIYMGLQGLAELAEGLMAHGLKATMPAALIQQGTTENQRVITAPISQLPQVAAASGLRAPTLVIVGEVVSLHDKLAWFEGNGEGAFWG